MQDMGGAYEEDATKIILIACALLNTVDLRISQQKKTRVNWQVCGRQV